VGLKVHPRSLFGSKFYYLHQTLNLHKNVTYNQDMLSINNRYPVNSKLSLPIRSRLTIYYDYVALLYSWTSLVNVTINKIKHAPGYG